MVPSNASVAMPMVSESVGCGWIGQADIRGAPCRWKRSRVEIVGPIHAAKAIEDGTIQFSIDQQPYVQGYMAVTSLYHNMAFTNPAEVTISAAAGRC